MSRYRKKEKQSQFAWFSLSRAYFNRGIQTRVFEILIQIFLSTVSHVIVAAKRCLNMFCLNFISNVGTYCAAWVSRVCTFSARVRKTQSSSIPISRGRILLLLNTFFFSLYWYKKSPVMSDSLLSPLLDEQPLEKDERKKREEKRPFCYFLSWDLLHGLFRQVDELLQKVY